MARKFLNGQLVMVKKKSPHLLGGLAIVKYNYNDKYGFKPNHPEREAAESRYGLDFLSSDGTIRESSSWYKGELLTLVSDKIHTLSYDID